MRKLAVLVALMLLVTAAPAVAAPATPVEPPSDEERLQAYTAELDPGAVGELRSRGFDVVPRPDAEGLAEAILTGKEAEELRAEGLDLQLQGGSTREDVARLQQEGPEGVFRPYSGPGGIEEELRALAAERPDLVKLVEIGRTVQNKPIIALKVTRGANQVRDGSKPASLYTSTQHAREWITPEMNRRLLHYMVDNYGTDGEITQLLNRNELWFVIVLNPDGYDYTFTEGNRLWRKNLRDNDGDGDIDGFDGVDLNRNFPYKWGYDNEGSSPDPSGQTYRGTTPESEPETQAIDGLMGSLDFSFIVNYHSAAELLLYGVGWQVATPTPDDAIHVALAGTDQQSAVPGYDPDISAELYTTNGETTEHAHNVHDILGFTPEMATCQTASASNPDDEWDPADCPSVFVFPDDETLIQAEFEKNIPFALDIARSTRDPDDSESYQGREAPDFEVDTFDVSYGDPQYVQVNAKRALGPVIMVYQINGGPRRFALAREWEGGERYGDENNVYYHYLRGRVRGTEPGDEVSVTFRALGARSDTFSYSVASDSGNPVLIFANEDYDGFDPEPDPTSPTGAPGYLDAYASALEANGIGYDVWDQDAQGAPDPLGVLSHYQAIVWYTGDNSITQDEEDTAVLGQPDLGVADVQQYTTLAVRDYLNDGGKLFHTGEEAGYFGPFGVLFYANDDDPSLPCEATSGSTIFSECLLYSDDFYQYYLGAYFRTTFGEAETVTATAEPLTGTIDVSGGDGANNQDDAGQFVVTSDVLPVEEFPQFASEKSAEYVSDEPDPFQPLTGEWYVGAVHSDEAYMRLTRTIDLAGATSGNLSFALSYDTEPGFDYVIVEARTPGGTDWTTLPDLNGGTSTATGATCDYTSVHPQLLSYVSLVGGACTPTGTSGTWNAFNGNSDGWTQASFDLSAYAGRQVEVSITYVTDQAVGGTGAFVDDTVVTVGGTVEENGFETTLDPWTIPGAPTTSPGNLTDWERSQSLVEPIDYAAAVTTEDSVYFGFGFEAIATVEQRNAVMGQVMAYLLGDD